jgi:hypothetical protein
MTEGKARGSVDHLAPAGTLPVLRDAFSTMLETVTRGISSAAKTTGAVGSAHFDAVSEVVKDAVRGAVGMGSELVPGAKAIILGVVRGTGEKGDAALKTLSHAAKSIIRHTADQGADLAAATKGLVLGAIASAKQMGVETTKAASMAAQGALEGAEQAGSVTVERVRAALKEPIGGSKVALPDTVAR